MKVVFMGTPDFAVPTLEAIIQKGHEVSLVITQPDKTKGRGGKVAFPPVKECALKYGIPVFQPVRIKDEECVAQIRKYDFDIIVVVAFGQILPKSILDMPKYGCINVHSSLLPAYRGAAPVQWSILMGEKETGVTTMYMDEGLDTGDIILQERTMIDEKETGGTLHDRLAVMGAVLLTDTMSLLEKGNATRIRQDETQSSYVGMLNKDMGRIDFNKSAIEIDRLVRGLSPWPSAFTYIDGKLLKIWDVTVMAGYDEGASGMKNGAVTYVDKGEFHIKTGQGTICVNEVQLQGKKRMDTDAFLRGYDVKVGTILKNESDS